MHEHHSNPPNKEVNRMTNKQLIAFLESIRIIVENAQSIDEIKSALGRIQSTLEGKSK